MSRNTFIICTRMLSYIRSSSEEANIYRIYTFQNKYISPCLFSFIVRIVLNHLLMEKLSKTKQQKI